MKQEQIRALFERFESIVQQLSGVECWSARELQDLLGYKEWRNFLKVIEKAKSTTENVGESIGHHFVEFNKMVKLGSGSEREIEDYALTRYACYLIAQNGDSTKAEVAFAQM